MLVARGVIGGILLFLGRELNFLFAAAVAALIGIQITPPLPADGSGWYAWLFIGLLAVIAVSISVINQRPGYFVSGFLTRGLFLVEYDAPNSLTVPLLPFLVGAVIGLIIVDIFTHWALMVVSCLFGAYYVTNLSGSLPRRKSSSRLARSLSMR